MTIVSRHGITGENIAPYVNQLYDVLGGGNSRRMKCTYVGDLVRTFGLEISVSTGQAILLNADVLVPVPNFALIAARSV